MFKGLVRAAVTVIGRHLAGADADATAALAMGTEALAWLAGVDGYCSTVVAQDRTCYVSDSLPLRRSS